VCMKATVGAVDMEHLSIFNLHGSLLPEHNRVRQLK
jgi:hypothetical protein